MADLTFSEMHAANMKLAPDAGHSLADWTENDFMVAAIGELGLAAKKLKKRRRGKDVDADLVGLDLGNAVLYIELLATRLQLDLAEMVRRKFNEIAKKDDSEARL